MAHESRAASTSHSPPSLLAGRLASDDSPRLASRRVELVQPRVSSPTVVCASDGAKGTAPRHADPTEAPLATAADACVEGAVSRGA